MYCIKHSISHKWKKQVVIIGILFLFFAISGVHHNGEAKEQSETYEKLKIFSEVLYLIQTNYLEEIDRTSAIYSSIHGMVGATDSYGAFMPPDVYREIQMENQGEFGEPGIQIAVQENQLMIIAPFDETPAYHAGIHSGDRIVKIDGQSTQNMQLMEAVKLLRGPIGSRMTISIMREDSTELQDFPIIREVIEMKSLMSKRILNNNIGYIRLRQFQKNSPDELENALNELEQRGMKGLVLDLRDNPGGFLNSAVNLADKFLEKGKLIVYTKGRKKNQDMRFMAQESTPYTSYPLIILVNRGSAYASEIVAGALQDHSRALILGTPTFGKGIVQSVVPLSDGAGLRLTSAKCYTPNGHAISDNGIRPDIVVEQSKTERTVKFGDLTSDIQLQRAINILKFHIAY